MTICRYEKGECSGLECNCEKCLEIRSFLEEKQEEGEIEIIK